MSQLSSKYHAELIFQVHNIYIYLYTIDSTMNQNISSDLSAIKADNKVRTNDIKKI